MMIRITVIGSSGRIPPEVEEVAVNIGKEIAKAGAILITGGRDGVMEAACKGAKQVGGITVGILPGDTLSGANPYLDIVITTGMGYARNYINICSGDAIVSIGGRGGTLSEIGYAIALEKPLVLMKGTGGATDAIMQTALINSDKIMIAETPKEAMKGIRRILSGDSAD